MFVIVLGQFLMFVIVLGQFLMFVIVLGQFLMFCHCLRSVFNVLSLFWVSF